MLIDAHVHLDRYEDKLAPAIQEINQHGILTISNSMDLPSYRRNLEIAKQSKYIIPTFGVHPWNAASYAKLLKNLTDAIDTSPMLGEIGLDYHFMEDTKQYPAQKQVLEFFLKAAQNQNKIVNLHTKGSEKKILNLLEKYEIQRAIIHWYSGPLTTFDKMVAKGFYFTIGVEIQYSDHIKTIAKALPYDRLLTETDNPGGLKWLNGRIGMPSDISTVVDTLAHIKKTTPENIIQTVEANFLRLIDDDPWLSKVKNFIKDKKREQAS